MGSGQRPTIKVGDILGEIDFGPPITWTSGGRSRTWERAHASAQVEADGTISLLLSCAVGVAREGGEQVASDLIELTHELLPMVRASLLAGERHEAFFRLRQATRAVGVASRRTAPEIASAPRAPLPAIARRGHRAPGGSTTNV